MCLTIMPLYLDIGLRIENPLFGGSKPLKGMLSQSDVLGMAKRECVMSSLRG
jgi:hypothetical protein